MTVNLTAIGGLVNSASVTSADPAPGVDALQLSAECAAFKFLLRQRYPGLMTDEIDGFAALRQGIAMFTQYAGTAPGSGDKAQKRVSSLEKAAFNLSFFARLYLFIQLRYARRGTPHLSAIGACVKMLSTTI